MKMTFQPKKRQRSKVHGFRARMRRKKSVSCKKSKRKSKIIRLIGSKGPQVIVAFLIIRKQMRRGFSLMQNKRRFHETFSIY